MSFRSFSFSRPAIIGVLMVSSIHPLYFIDSILQRLFQLFTFLPSLLPNLSFFRNFPGILTKAKILFITPRKIFLSFLSFFTKRKVLFARKIVTKWEKFYYENWKIFFFLLLIVLMLMFTFKNRNFLFRNYMKMIKNDLTVCFRNITDRTCCDVSWKQLLVMPPLDLIVFLLILYSNYLNNE